MNFKDWLSKFKASEPPKTDILYHWMNSQKAWNIFRSDKMAGTWEHYLEQGEKFAKGISTSWLPTKFQLNGTGIRLVLDGKKITSDHKIHIISSEWTYWRGIPEFQKRREKMEGDPTAYENIEPQLDEVFIEGDLIPLHDYVVSINVENFVTPKITALIEEYTKRFGKRLEHR